MEIKQIGKYTFEMQKEGEMKAVPIIYADEEIISVLKNEEKNQNNSLNQLRNLSTLPGLKGVIVCPDLHVGYGCPIGTATVSDLKEGVITFASTGFDINCLYGKARILQPGGVTKEIKAFEKNWFDEKVSINSGKLNSSKIIRFQKVVPKEVFKLTTESGREIIATPEHPFYSKNGKKELAKLRLGDDILVHPFEGVPYEEPKEETLLNEKKVKEYCVNKTAEREVLRKLKSNGMLPLKTTNKKLPILLKILGYLQGDGNLTMTKKLTRASFYGKKEDLELIKQDIESLGFGAFLSKRNRTHKFRTFYGESNFEYEESSLSNSSLAFCLLLKELGGTAGNKASQNFSFPVWIKKQPLWMKRLYLAAFFGAELTTPCAITGAKYNLNQPVISMNKHDYYTDSGKIFLSEILNILGEFGVTGGLIKERIEFINGNSVVSKRIRLVLNGTSRNLINLYSRVGFEYNNKRFVKANYAIQYLLMKERIITERKNAQKDAKMLYKKGFGAKAIFDKLKQKYPHVNKRFYERSIYEERKTSPRIAFMCEGFEEFIKNQKPSNGFVWDKISSITKAKPEQFVYDFTVDDYNHNFIANGFVVGNCGIHSLILPFTAKEIEAKKKHLAEQLFRDIPAGVGIGGRLKINKTEMDEILEKGAEYVVEKGYGTKKDLKLMEENGKAKGVNPKDVSDKAKERAYDQVGTLGSGNHYCEVQEIEKIFDEKAAKIFGIEKGKTFVSIHCGSRALGHQIGTDYLEILDNAAKKYGISIPERDLVCAPIESEEGKKYFSAINAATNAAFANRQVIGVLVKRTIARVMGASEKEIKTFYDIGHNTAKLEKHLIEGKKKEVLVQRKGSTRGFAPGMKEVPLEYRKAGQPVIVGGSMGTSSFILKGTEKAMQGTFGSTIHGAGRSMSRTSALKKWKPEELLKQLNEKGIIVKAHSLKGLPEEAPEAYKNISSVVEIMHRAGISEKVAELKPMICIKG